MPPIFSLPLSPYIRDEEYDEVYLPFVHEYSEYIYDIYVTMRIPPFTSDAMGGEFELQKLIDQALRAQKDTAKIVSATFNDTRVPPTEQNLNLFIEHFAPLYEAGIHSITLPQMHWMLTGRLFEKFPELKIKNSVLNRVDNAQGYWDSALAGYSVVNLDRRLLRDIETLREIKKAQKLFTSQYGFAPLTQILANEHCIGLCPVMDEHYTLNLSTGTYGIDYTCKAWKTRDEAYVYRVANISPFRTDIDELLSLVDLLKLHGRGGTALLQESMQIVGDYAKGKEVFEFGKAMIEGKNPKAVESWRKAIKSCRFQCWGCSVCDEIK
jgi:hypothetical protein